MMPNSPNQPANSATSGIAGESSAAYPQEQSPRISEQQLGKDPVSADKSNGKKVPVSQSQPKKEPPTKETKTDQSQTQQAQQSTASAGEEEQFDSGLLESAVLPGLVKPQPEELFFEWQANSRPFKKHNRQFFTSVGIIGLLMALILVFAGQWLPMAVVVAVIFVIYVFNTIPPGTAVYQFTTYGIRVEEKLYYWEEMGRFWFTEKYGENILNIEIARFPNRLSILTGELNKDDLTVFLSEILLNQQPPPTTNEKIVAWAQRKFPFDLDK